MAADHCRIRRAVPTDAAGVAAVHAAARQAILPESLHPLFDGDATAHWRHRLTDDLVLAAFDAAGEVIGMAVVVTADPVSLDQLYVVPAHWRRGVGRALVAAVAEHARAAAATRVGAWVLSGNAGARAFYTAVGFRETGEHRLTGVLDVELEERRLLLNLTGESA
jgi:ribosomal protein S18 acetylase RimI-like enzyme